MGIGPPSPHMALSVSKKPGRPTGQGSRAAKESFLEGMKPSSFAFSARVPTFLKLQGLNLFLIAILTFDLPTQSKRIEITDEVPQGILQAWHCSRILVFLMEIDKSTWSWEPHTPPSTHREGHLQRPLNPGSKWWLPPVSSSICHN